MRRLLRALVTGDPPGDTSTLVDPAVLDPIRAAVLAATGTPTP
jgi:hypothetical protein